jgi:aryl-alcohol dehydrogenase-like predicted oxidoreductase
MEYRILGKTNLKVSAIAMGSWQLSGPITIDGKADGFPDIGRDQAIKLIHACADLGINVIDSAEIYGMDGEGERRIGAAIQGNRDRWIISTKFGLRRGSNGERIIDSSPQTIRTSLEGSLKRLQTDYVDIYLYHSFPDAASLAEGKAILDTLKQEGKIRFYGISADNAPAVEQFVNQDAADVVQFNQSLTTHSPEMLELVKQHHLGSMVRGALGAGLLSGRYFHRRPQVSTQDIRQPWLNRAGTRKYAAYEKFIPHGFSMSTLALRYLLDFPTTHTIVLGGKTITDYQDAIRVFQLSPLGEPIHDALVDLRLRLQQPSFKRQVVNTLKQVLVGSRA